MRAELSRSSILIGLILSVLLASSIVSAGQAISTQRRLPATSQPQPMARATLVDPAPSGTPQQDGPNLAETIEFIKGKVNGLVTAYTLERRNSGENFENKTETRWTHTYEFVHFDKSQIQLRRYDVGKTNTIDKYYSTVKGTLTTTARGEGKQETLYSFNLADFTPAGVKVEECSGLNGTGNCYYVTLITTNSKGVLTYETITDNSYMTYFDSDGKETRTDKHSSPRSGPKKGAGLYVNFPDRELAERIAKAFAHAIKLCGGKSDPF